MESNFTVTRPSTLPKDVLYGFSPNAREIAKGQMEVIRHLLMLIDVVPELDPDGCYFHGVEHLFVWKANEALESINSPYRYDIRDGKLQLKTVTGLIIEHDKTGD